MDAVLFWQQWVQIVPHLPTNQPGPERKDDRRILSGIMHVLKIGCRWVDCQKAYGPHNKAIYSRKRRRKRFWVGHFIFSL